MVRLGLAAFAAALVLWQPAAPAPQAELVLRHGRIYTVDAARRWVQAVAVSNGRLVFVGDDRGVEPFIGAATRVVDLGGRLVLPAFHDSHVHPVSAGLELGQCNLNESRSVEAVLATIRSCAAKGGPWVVGGGWDLTLFPGGNPHRQMLDAIIPDRPAIFYAADGHSAWVNSRALQMAEVTGATRDPANGRIERDASGAPSGTLREAASDLVDRLAPDPSERDYDEGLQRALRVLNRFGIVSFQEASAGEETLNAYARADRAGTLTARVRAAMTMDSDEGEEQQLAKLIARREKYRLRRVNAGSVKFFVDGVIESHTAALLEPYLTPGTAQPRRDRGTPNYSPELLARLVARVDRERFQVHMHAIGDRAIRIGLDAIEGAIRANGPRDRRPHLAHIELFDPADIPRFRQLGAIANFQPLWAQADSYVRTMTEPFLGPQRSRWLYPIGSLVATGAMVAGGSDWSVSSANPLDAIQVGITRRPIEEPAAAPWIPEERVDLPAMIAAYTIAGAYVNFEDDVSGSIERGKLADLIVLDKDLFDLPAQAIHTARVIWTLLEGREVHRAEDWTPAASVGRGPAPNAP